MLVINYFQRQELVNLREERDSLTKHMVESHALQGGDIQNYPAFGGTQYPPVMWRSGTIFNGQ